MNILFLDNCVFIKYEKVMTKQVSAMHSICSDRVSITNGFWVILTVAYKSYINVGCVCARACMRATPGRAVQQRAPLKQNVENEAAAPSGANMVLSIN